MDNVVDMQQARKDQTWTEFVSSNPWLSMIFNALFGSCYRERKRDGPAACDNALKERFIFSI